MRLAQQLGHAQHEVGAGGALGQPPGQLHADDLRDQHRDGLAEHGGLGLDAADTPADDAKAVDHRRVRVGADERVGIRHAVPAHHDEAEVLEVDLVHDAGSGRHHAEVIERGLAPAQELVALLVALELLLDVEHERHRRAELVDLHRVVDHEVDGLLRVDLCRVAAHLRHRVAHCGQVDDAGDAGEVLEQHARWHERDLGVGVGGGVPLRDGLDLLARHGDAVLAAQQVLEQDAQAERQLLEVHAERVGGSVEAIDLVRPAGGLE